MFCSHCGKEVAAGAKFCANCGAAVNSQPTPAAKPPKAPAPTAQREVPAVEQVGSPSGNVTGSGGQPEKKKKGVPKKPLVIVAAVLVLIVGFGAVLSLFGDGSEPDSGSDIPSNLDNNTSDIPESTTTKTDAFSLDWIDDILLVPGGAELYYFEDSDIQAHSRPYTFEEGGIVDFIGYSNSEQINYRTAEIDGGTVCTGLAPDGAVYAEVWDDCPGPVGDYYFSVVCEYEPVIGRRDDGYCYLFYMREYDSGGGADPCYEMYMVQPTDSPNYEDWNFKAYVHCNNLQYFDYLNGTKELEIISIPNGNNQHEAFPENGDTPSASDVIVPDWVDKIPEVPGTPSENPTGTTVIEERGDYMKYAIDGFYKLSAEDMLICDEGAPVSNINMEFYLTNPRLVEYGVETVRDNAELYGFSLPDYQVVYVRECNGSTPFDGLPRDYYLTEPLIVKTEQGIYLLCYKHNGTYVVIRTMPDDPSTSYNGWRTIGRVFVDGVEYYDYLNGTLPVEVVSIPGEDTQ